MYPSNAGVVINPLVPWKVVIQRRFAGELQFQNTSFKTESSLLVAVSVDVSAELFL